MTTMKERRTALLEDVAAHTQQLLGDYLPSTTDKALLEQIGHAVADRLASNWGGQVVSIPKDESFRNSKRDRAIVVDHRDGRLSVNELAEKYELHARTIRFILKRAPDRDPNLDQPELF